jgi:hypothetical protein
MRAVHGYRRAVVVMGLVVALGAGTGVVMSPDVGPNGHGFICVDGGVGPVTIPHVCVPPPP